MTKSLPPKVSIVIPVYQEEDLGSLLQHLATLELWDESEVIVVSADEESHFAKHRKQLQLAEFQSLSSKVQLLHSPKGRGVQMNRGAKVARGVYLFFLHADSVLGPASLVHIIKCLESGFIGGGFSLCIDGVGWWYKWVSAVTNWRARCTQVPYGDQGIFVYRNVFESLGGYREIPIMEDVDFIRRLRKKGHPIQILPNIIKTSPRRYQREGFFRRMLKNRLLMLAYMAGVPLKTLSRYYYGS